MPRARGPERIAAVVVAALLALATAGCVSVPAAATSRTPATVIGYAEAGSTSAASLRSDRSTITTLGVDGVNIGRSGTTLSAPSGDVLHLLRQAHADHQKAELLVGNFDARLVDFSPAIGDALLGSASHIDTVTAGLAAEARRHGWDGVTIDLESLSARHPAGLTRFVTLLKHRLGAHRSVSICLMATTGSYLDLGYDLRGLGRAADHVVLMAYDQHGPTWTGAGPVGGTPWVTATLAPLIAAVPRSRIQLGVAGYGYTWPRHGTGTQLSDAGARDAALHGGGAAVWDARQQEWHTTTRAGTVIWWSDARTYRARAAYAERQRLGGVAVWSVGLSDPIRND